MLPIRRALGLVLAAVALVYLGVAAVMFTTTFLFQTGLIDGDAMEPTLAHGDLVLVNKWTFQTRVPRVGDIVMHYYPLNPDKVFVRRVIGEQGDQITLIKGRVYRNGVPTDETFVLPEHRSRENWGPKVIQEGYYFVMGDGRTASSDSRHWGEVPRKYILGRIQLRWWPLSRMRSF
jgi:signal peptidase I